MHQVCCYKLENNNNNSNNSNNKNIIQNLPLNSLGLLVFHSYSTKEYFKVLFLC